MNRKISVREKDVSLREALDRVATVSGIRLSYAADLVPLSRRVCLDYRSATVSRILLDLLDGTGVRPVAVGDDQIALTPVRETTAPRRAEDATGIIERVGQLDRVIVTGNTTSSPEKSLPNAIGIVGGDQLSRRNAGTLSAALDGAVPGLWMWEQSPLSMLARYGSIRGASSFGVSYPKVYVDGIEVANSLLVTHLDPDAISRIEVIRGPQGAALYGADAISGVMNIVTRQGGTENGAPRAELRTQGGATASDYTASSVFSQRHAASLRYGTGTRSVHAGMTATRMGAFIPGAFSQQLTASGGARRVGAWSVVTGTLRLFAQDARTPSTPLLGEIGAGSSGVTAYSLDSLSRLITMNSPDRQSVRQYTLGGTATFTPGERWTHSAVAGVDGYTLSGAHLAGSAFLSAVDSALDAATGNAVRATFRATSIGRFGSPEGTSATVTFGAEQSLMREQTTMQAPFGLGLAGQSNALVSTRDSRSNTGLIGHVTAGFRDAVFVSGGVRVERNSGADGLGEIATLPMLGASAIRSFGIATIKLRSAFGKGIRPVQTPSRAGMLMGLRGSLLGSSLSPEEQTGIEFGADAFLGNRVALHVTRFDQQASGLVQPVSVAARVPTDSGPRYRHISYELQNVGAISNRGWELQGSFTEGPWSVGATYSLVDSRVGKLGAHYTGELEPGDRMLEVPSRTFGINAAYAQRRWSTSWTLSRASDWINYDRLALLAALVSVSPDEGIPVGPELRSFWKTYEGVTRLGGTVGVNLSRGMTFTLNGENLFDEQRGEPDNITVLPGRTVSAGLRISF